MGCAEVISLSEVRASTQWQRLRNALHARFDQWLDRLEEQLPDPKTSLAEVTEAVWKLRQALTGGLSETIIEQAHVGRTDSPVCLLFPVWSALAGAAFGPTHRRDYGGPGASCAALLLLHVRMRWHVSF